IRVIDYDAIVADIKMPGMDGLALLAEIRTLRPDTPTVLITGHGNDDLAVLALRGGAYDFVQKPIDRDYIVASLTRAIEERERRRRVEAQQALLDRSRITAGKLVLDARPVELAAVAEAALDAVRADAEAKEVRVERVSELGAEPVQGDPARLQQIMWNLLSNAVKFSPRGGRVLLRLARADGQAITSVRDEGEGIEPQFLPHIFEPFQQADSTSMRAHGGLGLGLAIVHDLVELHRGTVEVESKGKGRGATFTVKLPGSDAARGDATQPALSGGEFHPSPSLRGVRVLLVDDDAGARESVAAVLEQSGASVRAVESVAEAVETLEHEPPDVLLSDIAMPGMDGYAFLGQARSRLPGAQLPASALTSYA